MIINAVQTRAGKRILGTSVYCNVLQPCFKVIIESFLVISSLLYTRITEIFICPNKYKSVQRQTQNTSWYFKCEVAVKYVEIF